MAIVFTLGTVWKLEFTRNECDGWGDYNGTWNCLFPTKEAAEAGFLKIQDGFPGRRDAISIHHLREKRAMISTNGKDAYIIDSEPYALVQADDPLQFKWRVLD